MANAKAIYSAQEARKLLLAGINKAANAVTATLGYNGKYAIISNLHTKPRFSRDGVTVAREIKLNGAVENTGALLIMEVAAKTVSDFGDGTTTATLLCQKIIEEGFKELDKNINPIELKNGVNKAVDKICEKLLSMAIPIEQTSDKLKEVSTIAANNDEEIGGFIADAYKQIGKEGTITIDESRSFETRIEVVNGLQFDKGYISQYFVTNVSKLTCELENPYILIYDGTISMMKDELLPIFELVHKTGRPLFIIAEDVNGEALHGLLKNHSMAVQKQGGAFSCVVKCPAYGDLKDDILGDISAVTHASIISQTKGQKLMRTQLNQLGEADRVIIGRENTLIVNGKGIQKNIDERKQHAELKLSEATKEYDKLKQEERISKLSGGIGVIYVGAQTDIELREKKDRTDDAIRATKAALQEGIVVGGGTALIRCIESLDEIICQTHSEKTGIDVIRKAITAPLVKIAENGGYNSMEVLDKVIKLKDNFGYNAQKNNFEDLMLAGVIDPVKVVKGSLQNAASVAIILLRSDPLLVEM